MFDCDWKENGKLKLLIIVGTRLEIIRLAAVIKKCRTYFDTILAHTGQNYDYNLNGVFFHDLELDDPEVYLNAVVQTLAKLWATSSQNHTSLWRRSNRMLYWFLVIPIPACR